MKTTVCIFIISSCLTIGATLIAHAQAGALDPSFGSGGKVTTAVVSCNDVAYSIAIQSDGKIVVAGHSNDCLNNYYPDFNFSLVRYNSDGTLDSSFSSDGKVTTDLGSSSDECHSIAIQTDGKIIAAGSSPNGFALVRYNSEGNLDSTFGFGGIEPAVIAGYARSVAIQTDGKIVVAGDGSNDFILVRYNSNGGLDGTFGSGGIVTTDFGGALDVGNAVVIQSDGKILVSGYSKYNSDPANFALARYNTDGSLDGNFDSDGKITTDFGGSDSWGESVSIQSDGKIVVAGYACCFDFAVARYNSDGSLDNTFDSDGKVTTDFGASLNTGYSLAIQSNGKIIVGGVMWTGSDDNFALARYNSDGSMDSTFDFDGKVNTNLGGFDFGLSIAIQGNGKIVVAGYSDNGFENYFALARYNGDSEASIVENTVEENTITVSPNPVQTRLIINLTAPANEFTICVYDVQGRMISLPISFQSDKAQLNTQKLPDGFYTLQIINNKTRVGEVGKFVKQY